MEAVPSVIVRLFVTVPTSVQYGVISDAFTETNELTAANISSITNTFFKTFTTIYSLSLIIRKTIKIFHGAKNKKL